MGKRKKWLGALFSIALCSTIAISGCSQKESGQPDTKKSEDKQITLRFSWWGSDARHQATIDALNKYMELHPNVKVEAEYGGFNGYPEKLKTQIAGGTAPDLIQVDQPWLYDLSSQSDVFEDLNNLKDEVDLSNFDQKFLQDYATVNNKLLGVPTGLTGMILYYNKDFLDKYEIPEETVWDWDNLLEYGKKVHDQSNGKDVLLNVDSNLVSELFRFYVIQKTGNPYIKDDHSLGYDKEIALEAMQYVKKLLDNGVIPPFEESAAFEGKVEQNPKWFNGNIGFTLNYVSNIPVMNKDISFKTGVAPSIIAKEAKMTAVPARPSQIYSIFKNSKHVKEAAKLLNWLVNDKEAALILGDVRGTPASKSALQALTDAGKADPEITKGTDIALKTSGGPENGLVSNAELVKIRIDIIQKLAYKKLTPQEAANQIYDSETKQLKELN